MTVNKVLEEACVALPGTDTLASRGLSESLIQAVDSCKRRAEVQRRVLEAEMDVWSIVSDQKKHEFERTSAKNGPYKDADLGEEKILQRGWVGNDGVG